MNAFTRQHDGIWVVLKMETVFHIILSNDLEEQFGIFLIALLISIIKA